MSTACAPGLLEAMREFCEFRNLLPRGVKLAPEDVWDRCCYVLSSKLARPAVFRPDQGAPVVAGGAAFVSGVVKDAFSLWLNQHTEEAGKAGRAVPSATPRAACAPARK